MAGDGRKLTLDRTGDGRGHGVRRWRPAGFAVYRDGGEIDLRKRGKTGSSRKPKTPNAMIEAVIRTVMTGRRIHNSDRASSR